MVLTMLFENVFRYNDNHAITDGIKFINLQKETEQHILNTTLTQQTSGEGLKSIANYKKHNVIETFGMNEIRKKNNDDFKEMEKIDDELNRNISDYSTKHRLLMDKTRNFIETTSENNKYSGKNVRLGDGTIGYVTERGYFKKFPNEQVMNVTAGKNGCPPLSDVTDVNATSNNAYVVGAIINTEPELIVASPMKAHQPCGNEGTNIQVTKSGKSDAPASWEGCYASRGGTGLEYQNDMGKSAGLQSCKIRAQDLGYSLFSLTNGREGTSQCHVGNSLKSATSGGIATKREVSYTLLEGNGNHAKGGLMRNGQIGLGVGDINTWTTTRFNGDRNCHPVRGGFVNKKNTIANYGVNCHGRNIF